MKKTNFQKGIKKESSWVKTIFKVFLIIVGVFLLLVVVGTLIAPDDVENKEFQNNSKTKKDNDKQIDEKDNESNEESAEYKAKHKFMKTPKDEFNILNTTNFKEIQRNPDDFINEPYTFGGTVIQVSEGDIYNNYRIAIDDDYDNIVLVEIVALTNDNRILEDDNVTIYSQYEGLTTYESVSGSDITVPKFFSDKDMIEIK